MRPTPSGRTTRWQATLALGCVVGAVVEAGLMVVTARHGFDFTDEGYYLNAIADDSQGSVLTSQFGRVYRPVALLVSGDVTSLRWFNILTLLLAGGLLGWAVATRSGRDVGRWALGSTVAGVGAAALGFVGTGLLTPSYNSLAATGVLLVAGGLVLGCTAAPPPTRARVAIVLVGIGGLVSFLGKPSSGVATGVVAGVALLVSGRAGRRVAAAAAVVAAVAVLVVSVALTGTPLGLLHQVSQGVDEARTLQAGHDLASALGSFGWPETTTRSLQLSLLLLAATFTWARAGVAVARRTAWVVAAVAVTVVAAWVLSGQLGTISYFVPTRSTVILGAPLGLLLAALTTGRRPERTSAVLAAALLLLPHAWVFGSNNDYWHGASLLYVLWFAAGLVLLAQRDQRAPSALTHAVPPMLLMTAAVLAAVLANPYRQVVPLLSQHTATAVGATGTLRLAPDFAEAIDGFRAGAAGAGFEPGTPVLDLTGQMPGLVYALDGRATGAPWIIGGYPGSDAVARRTLSRTPCATVARSWLVLEPDGARSLDPAVLSVVGASVEDWTPVVAERVATDRVAPRRIVLLRPAGSSSEREAACEAAR